MYSLDYLSKMDQLISLARVESILEKPNVDVNQRFFAQVIR